MKKRGKPHEHTTHYVVEGRKFSCIAALHAVACEMGYVGCAETLRYRLKTGTATWARLLRPINPNVASAAKRGMAKRRAEMAPVIAALDARKAEMKEGK